MYPKAITLGAALSGLLMMASCAPGPKPPKLAVIIVVDQMRADLLTRFADLYTGGFARIIDEGRVFTQAYHDHAFTYTGTGHATVSTGCYPSNHGVIGNSWEDRISSSRVYCCEDTSCHIPDHEDMTGRSPVLMKRPGLGDLIKESSPGARVVSLALKDRSAIFLGGLIAHFAAKAHAARGKEGETSMRHGMLFAAGLITGEVLVGILMAVPIVIYESADVLAVNESLRMGSLAGIVVIAAVVLWLYRVSAARE